MERNFLSTKRSYADRERCEVCVPIFKEYSKFYDKIYANRNYKAEAKFIYRWAGKPQVIADLGCGTGRHHKYWKCFIIGVDQSEEMLKYCKETKNRVYWQENIEDFTGLYAPCFTALFNVVGYCNLDKVMGCMKQNKGEVFIFDCWDEKKVQETGFQSKEKVFKWGKVNIIPYLGGLIIHITKKNGETITEEHDVHPYSIKRIKYLCKKYGYTYKRKDTKTWQTWYRLVKN